MDNSSYADLNVMNKKWLLQKYLQNNPIVIVHSYKMTSSQCQMDNIAMPRSYQICITSKRIPIAMLFIIIYWYQRFNVFEMLQPRIFTHIPINKECKYHCKVLIITVII